MEASKNSWKSSKKIWSNKTAVYETDNRFWTYSILLIMELRTTKFPEFFCYLKKQQMRVDHSAKNENFQTTFNELSVILMFSEENYN